MAYLPGDPPDDPPRAAGARSVVEWGLGPRLTALALALFLSCANALLGWQLLVAHAGLIVLVFVAVEALLLGAFLTTWCMRSEFDEQTITYRDFLGRSRTYNLSDVIARGTSPGPLGWRYEVLGGGRIYVNSYQVGGSTLIELLDRYAQQRLE